MSNLKEEFESNPQKLNKWIAVANETVVAEGDSDKEVTDKANERPDVLVAFTCQVGGPLQKEYRRRRTIDININIVKG